MAGPKIKRPLHLSYLELARELYKKSEPLKKVPHITGKRIARLAGAIIFIALALESFINEFGDLYIQDFVDMEKLSFDVKWMIFPRLYYGGKVSFEKDKEPYQSISEIYKWRNFLVHYKPRFRDPDSDKWEKKYNSLKHDDVRKLYREAVKAMKNLCKDPELDDHFCGLIETTIHDEIDKDL